MSKNTTPETSAARIYLKQIGWSQRALGEAIPNANEVRIRRMFNGALPMDPGLLEWLQIVAEFHVQHPPPLLTRSSPDQMSEASSSEGPDQ